MAPCIPATSLDIASHGLESSQSEPRKGYIHSLIAILSKRTTGTTGVEKCFHPNAAAVIHDTYLGSLCGSCVVQIRRALDKSCKSMPLVEVVKPQIPVSSLSYYTYIVVLSLSSAVFSPRPVLIIGTAQTKPELSKLSVSLSSYFPPSSLGFLCILLHVICRVLRGDRSRCINDGRISHHYDPKFGTLIHGPTHVPGKHVAPPKTACVLALLCLQAKDLPSPGEPELEVSLRTWR
ncbi:hypothetical protein V8F33_011629 [Rhypophila sp. PSN 637]